MPAAPKPVRENKKNILEQLDDVTRRLVFWRDECRCVEVFMDGGRCFGSIQWGHFIPRQQSKFLKYSLSNTFCQCQTHNYLHDKGAQTMGAWYGLKFGEAALGAIDAAARLNAGGKVYVSDYRETLEHYIELYENRPSVFDFATLVTLGYYGDIIKANIK